MHINDILARPDLQDIKARFALKFIHASEDECWTWTGAVMKGGYGKLNIAKQLFGAHRLAYLFNKGAIPNAGRFKGANVCRHTCDNTGCVNPKHIILGTHEQNMADAFERNRMSLGTDRIDTVLTDEQVRAIRADTRLHREIAEDYPVERRQISRIKQGVRRIHVC